MKKIEVLPSFSPCMCSSQREVLMKWHGHLMGIPREVMQLQSLLISLQETSTPILLLHPPYLLCARHVLPRASVQKSMHQFATATLYVLRRQSISKSWQRAAKVSTQCHICRQQCSNSRCMHLHWGSTCGGNILMQWCLQATESAGGEGRAMNKVHYQ